MLRDLYPELFGFFPRYSPDGGAGAAGTGGGAGASGAGAGAGTSTSGDAAAAGAGGSDAQDKPGDGVDGDDGDDAGAGDDHLPKTQTELDAIILKRAKRLTAKAITEAQAKWQADQDRQKAEADAESQGKWQELADARKGEIDTLKQQLAERDQQDLARKVGRAHGLPDEIIDLLKGDDEAALTTHAKSLAKIVGVQAAPPTNGGEGLPPGVRQGTGSSSNGSGTGADANRSDRPKYVQSTNRVKVPGS